MLGQYPNKQITNLLVYYYVVITTYNNYLFCKIFQFMYIYTDKHLISLDNKWNIIYIICNNDLLFLLKIIKKNIKDMYEIDDIFGNYLVQFS